MTKIKNLNHEEHEEGNKIHDVGYRYNEVGCTI